MNVSHTTENPLFLTWQDSAWIPILNATNVMDYFAQNSNPFYDRTCNNEVVKMQRLNPEQLNSMQGLEFMLLHAQDPILYVVRKQFRHSPTQANALADYYIIAGIVYQAPDMAAVLNSRMLNATHSLQAAFSEAQTYAKYHPSKGYWWEFKDKESTEQLKGKEKKVKKEEPSSVFQRQRVDILLDQLSRNFPPKYTQTAPMDRPEEISHEVKVEVKQEKVEERGSSTNTTSQQQQQQQPQQLQQQQQPQPLQQQQLQQSSSKPPPEKKPKLR